VAFGWQCWSGLRAVPVSGRGPVASAQNPDGRPSLSCPRNLRSASRIWAGIAATLRSARPGACSRHVILRGSHGGPTHHGSSSSPSRRSRSVSADRWVGASAASSQADLTRAPRSRSCVRATPAVGVLTAERPAMAGGRTAAAGAVGRLIVRTAAPGPPTRRGSAPVRKWSSLQGRRAEDRSRVTARPTRRNLLVEAGKRSRPVETPPGCWGRRTDRWPALP